MSDEEGRPPPADQRWLETEEIRLTSGPRRQRRRAAPWRLLVAVVRRWRGRH